MALGTKKIIKMFGDIKCGILSLRPLLAKAWIGG
jgi:hypothetical protein